MLTKVALCVFAILAAVYLLKIKSTYEDVTGRKLPRSTIVIIAAAFIGAAQISPWTWPIGLACLVGIARFMFHPTSDHFDDDQVALLKKLSLLVIIVAICVLICASGKTVTACTVYFTIAALLCLAANKVNDVVGPSLNKIDSFKENAKTWFKS